MRALVAALLVLAVPAGAQDKPDAFRITEHSILEVPGKPPLNLPPVLCLPQDAEDAVQAEFVRLQQTEARLKAENEKLREGPFSWRTILIVAGVGFAAGATTAYVVSR